MMLWKFYKNDEDACSYVYGTIHLATEQAFAHSRLAEKYIDRVAHYVSEMNLDVSGKGLELAECFQLSEGQTLFSFFSDKRFGKYRKQILKAFEVDVNDYERYCPFYVLNMISIIGLMQGETHSDRQVLDHHLYHYAQSNGKSLEGLESVDDQIRIAKAIPMDYQVKSFKKAMKNISAFKKSVEILVQLYARGDYKSLYKISKKSLGQIRPLLLYDRNHFFLDRIEIIVKEHPSFISIGAAHLHGDKGVLALFKKRGYKVKRVLV